MKRTGFTFVELAIVLVIIGIIMGMAIKGRTLIESAKTRSEVRKLEKIQAAIAGWYGNAGVDNAFASLSPTASQYKDWTSFSDLKASDYKAPSNDNWTLIVANSTVTTGAFGSSATGTNLAVRNANVSPRFVCNAENMLDDKDPIRGDVRSLYADSTQIWLAGASGAAQASNWGPTNSADNNSFAPCDQWSNANAGTAVINNQVSDTDTRLDFMLL